MYIGVLSPQRGLPARSAYASKIAAIASPVGIPGADPRRDVRRPARPRPRIVGIRATSSRKRSGVDRATVTPREQRDEERLVGNRDPRRAVEDHAQQRRPRAADAEDEERPAHWGGGATTSTAARAARPPTVT